MRTLNLKYKTDGSDEISNDCQERPVLLVLSPVLPDAPTEFADPSH